MDEQVLQDLYARAQSLGYKKGIEDFRTLIQTDQRVQDDNFAYAQSKGYKKTKEDFFGLLGMNQSTSTIPLKKKESAQSTESLSDDGSLAQSLPEATKKTLSKVGIEPQPTPKEDPLRFNQMPPQMQVEAAFKIIQGKGYQGTKEDFIAEYGIQVPQTQEEEYRNKDIFGQNIRNAYSGALRYSPQKKEVVAPAKAEPTPMEQSKEQFAEQFPKTIERIKQAPEEARQAGEYLETVRKGEREAELAQMQDNQQDEEFLRLVSGVDNLYIKAASEDKAERELNERFKKYGIVFAQSKAGHDVLIARTADGKKSIEIPLAASTADSNSKRLRDFIIQNGKAQTESMSEDFITKSLGAQNMRRGGRLNKDGSASTVEFMSFEQDGKFIVAPTLFPKDKLNYGADPRGWMKLEPAKAIEEARGRGELFEFKTKEEAERFAKGAWKDVTMSDLEGQKFFQERGLDYFDYKDRRDELLSIDKEQALIENTSAAIKSGEITNAKQYFSKKLSPEEAIKYSYLLNGNNLRPDLESYVQKRQQQKNELYAQVEDRTFFNDGKAQTTFEDFDVYLNKKSDESKKKAEETNKIAKQKYEELNAVSLEAFGIPATQLMTYKPKTQDEVNVINDIKQRMSAVVELQKVAAERYYASSTFFDSKLNKAARNEYDENMAAWWSEFNSAWSRGEAGAQLMKTIMGVNSVEEAGQLISEAMQDAEGGTRSRAFQTYMSSGALLAGDERAAKAFWSDPFEITANLVATSLAQLLPIGLRIVPATTLAGAGIGGGISAATTGGLGTPGGILSGAKYGLQTGMEMANFNMEYTNSFFEAAEEKGYDVKDPEQFVKAWDDDAVWNQTNNIGIRRGLAIGAVGLMSSSLAGRVFKVSKLASKAQKVGTFVAERAVFDPLMEGAGELLAQEWSTGTYDLKEIEGEMMGGIGNNAISAGFNIATSSLKNTNIDYANTLTDISAVAEESASDERISNWAANMRRLGQIDAETEQRIQRNVGLRRESKDLLSVGDNGKLASRDSKLQSRMMELMAARDEMSSTNNRREVYRNYIAQVNEELREIAETKKLRAPENAVNLSTMNAPTSAPGMPKYSINGRSMTKENFMDSVAKMSKSRYMRSRIVVDNDDTTIGQLNQKLIDKGFIAKPKTDAVQEQSTAQLSPQVSAAVGEGVGEQVPGQEEVAGEVEQERLREETQQQVEQSRGRLSELENAIPAVMEVTPEVLVQATNNELAPEQLDGVLSSIADDIISETELSPEQDALVSANKARVDELVSLKSEQEALSSEVNDLESMLSQSGGFQFRAEEGVTTQRDADVEGEITLYHSTPSNFTEFRVIGENDGKTESQYTELGIHLGTEEQAKKRAETKRIPKEKQRTIKVKINPKKVIRVTDKGRWTLSAYKNILFELGLIQDKKEIKSFEDVLAVLKDNNIDAFVYDNKYEGKGDSYIVFDNKNIEIEQSTEKPTRAAENPLQDVESTTKALEGVDGDGLNKIKSNFIIRKAEEISKKLEYLNCDAFCHKLVNNRLFKDVFDKVNFKIKFGGKTEKVVSELQKLLKVGDIIAFGDKNDARHYAVYLGDDSVYEVEGWGEKPRKYSLSKNIDTYTGLNNIYRDNELNREISEAYHKAKADNSNPELVKAVEDLLGVPKTGPQTRIDTKRGKKIGKFDALEGAPKTKGLVGPDPNLVAVAEEYAKKNGIPFVRQGEYVQANEKRGKRIALAFDRMKHDPSNPKVKEAYADLIRQTRMQYEALVDAGYEFTFFDSNSDPYQGNPSNAMRDLRENKKMAVYGTYDGYGTEGITATAQADNPLLEDTGLKWKDTKGVEHPVTANDLFRAVHDAFGHGLEGAGFRARGEENAWQAHVRLFTGPAVGAITSETRGQNSWLNFGPYGEQNKKASVFETVFSEQKIGLMPEWTWTEGRAADMTSEETSVTEEVQKVDEDAEVERIVSEMNELESPLVDTSAQIESTEGASTDIQELNSRLDTPLDVVNIQILDGVPVLITISDQLVASNKGVTDNVTGKKIRNLFGGLGFNGIKKFLNAAWANIGVEEAKTQHRKALEIYKNNKAIIEKFWADNPKYDGHVPMLVVKMGEDSILSNEAVSRLLIERIKSLNLSEDTKKEAFSNLQEKLNKFAEKYNAKLKEGKKAKDINARIKNPYTLAKFISDKKIKDFNGVLKSISKMPTAANAELIRLLTSGSVRKPGEKPKKPQSPGKDSIAKILLGDNTNYSILSRESITDVLTEPSTSNVPIGSVISVVGVKVAEKQADGTYKQAGGPISVDHPNYKHGVEGMSFGVVKSPMSIQSIMPAAYDAIVSKNIKKVKEGAKPIAASNATAIGLGASGLVGRTISTNPPKMMALISLINKAFPNVSVYTTTEAFNRILQNTDTKLTMKGDAVLYGVTANGDIYINPEVHNTESELFNTIIHEFGHVWLNMLLTSPEGSKGRKLYQQGINIIREGIKTDPKLKALYDSQMKLFNNNEADAINEMLAILIGNRGEMISKASTDIRTKFNDFLLAMWEYVRATFKMSKDISVDEISNMSLDDFLGTAMADLLSGQDMKISDAQLTKMRNLTSMARQDDSMQSIIDLGRQNGFSDQSIKEILMRRGFKAADIDTAMEVRVDLMTELPDAFANVEGGVKEGMKLFADVRQQLSKYAKKKVKEADGTTRTRTMSEIRQKALELLKEHPIFKAQATITKDELILAFDRSMSTRANRGVDAQIAEIRKGLKSKKMGVKELAAAQKKLINFVSSVLPQSKGYSVARIERIVRLIGSTNINNFDAQAERVMKIVEAQKDLMAKKDIADAVARQRQEMRDRRAGQKDLRSFQITLKNFIRTNLPKSKGYSQLMVNRLVAAVANTTTQNYVAQAVRVLNIVDKQRKLMSNQRIREIANVIVKSSRIAKTGSGKRRAGRVDADTQALFATMKQTMRALAMAQKGDSSMLDRISASVDPAILAGKGIDLDEVQQKIDNGEELTAAERDAFNTTVALQELGGIFSMSLEELDSLLERTKEMGTEGIARLKADKLVLSAEISSMKTQAEAQIKSDFGFLYDENGDLKTKNRLDSEFRQIWENFRKLKVWDGIKGWVQTIDFQSLTGFQDFMRKKIYHLGTLMNVLDKGGDFFKKNVYDVLNRMDEKSKRGFQIEMANLDSFARAFEFKNYKQFARSLNGPPVNINGKLLTIDQMMRVYALSKNPIQRNKLIDMGIDIDRVESFLTDEERGFVDMVVDYLSNSYFDGVNSIYSYVNNVNLGYVENYFPTKTIQTKIDGNILESGDFGSVFNAETAPALKERTDTKGEIDLSSDFTAVLENHFRSMERYKAMAIGVRKMVQIFKMEDVKTLLERTGTKDMIMRGLNFAINPDSMTRDPTTIVGKLSSKFTGFALSFKAIQILKQGSSFVQAFEDYTVRKGKPTPVLDHIMFMLDMAYIVATLPKQIKKAYDMSANVKERLDQGLEGDVYGLESGTGVFRPISKSSSAWAKARRAFQTGAAAPTVLGDIIGVLGYMAVYNRMIKQGFTHAEALEAFNSYNSTQQSRRATEKSPIQMSNNEFQRLFTMFGSTVFLQMNKIAQTSTNIMRSAKKGKMPKAKDVRGLMLNLAISNVLFVGAANIAKFIYGDDEDEEEALKAMRNAMLGLNVIYAIPIFGSALESMVAYAEGEPDRADDTINVFQNLFRKYKKAEEGLDDGNVWAAVQPLVEIVIGAQLDPFIGIYNYFGGDEDMQEDAAYDMLGITPSYRPSNDEKPVSTMGKEDMKRYFPDLYDETYGPNSPGYDIQQEINEMEKEIEKEQQQLKDEAYGYSE